VPDDRTAVLETPMGTDGVCIQPRVGAAEERTVVVVDGSRDGEDQGSERLGADRSGLQSGSEQKNLKVAPLR
jgi:hypothetical protein